MLRSNKGHFENCLLYDFIQLVFQCAKNFSQEKIEVEPDKTPLSVIHIYKEPCQFFRGYLQSPQEEQVGFHQFLGWFRINNKESAKKGGG